ncbi:unnamed protein product, partial [Laminaria digitata]
SSHTPSRYDPKQHAIVWDDSMCFPVRYRDLDRNSQLVIVLWGAKDRLVGVASMRFFDSNGSLAMGLQKRPFLFTDKLPFSWNPAAPPSGKEPGQDGVWCDGRRGPWGDEECSNDNVCKEDWGFRLERMREKYRLRTMDRADWLDPVSLSRVDRLVAALADPEELRKHASYQTETQKNLRNSPTLILEMPYFAHPVIHEERPYPGVPGGGGGGRAWGSSDFLAGAGSDAFLLVSDYEMEEDNPVEQKYRKLAHDQLRGLVDPELKPNRDERHKIDELVAGRQDHLLMEDRDLLWKFRYCLTDNKRALTKLLLSVDWGVDSEVAQVDGLLAEWARRAPIDAPDALKLLGRERTFQAEVVRRFAVDALRRASDDELLAFLLQLFLIERACKSLELANFFYWYLRVDLEDATHGHIYRGVQAAFWRVMRRTPESARVLEMLLAQDNYVQAVAMAHKEACELNGRKLAKDERLRELLKAPNLKRVPRRGKEGGGVGEGSILGVGGGGGGSVPMPLDPTVQITGLEPSSAFLFKSALYPCVIEFTVKRDAGHTRPAAAGSAASAITGGAGSTTAGGATALPATAGGRGAGGQKDDNATAAAAGAGGGISGGKGEGSSWLGQLKPKESSYKV